VAWLKKQRAKLNEESIEIGKGKYRDALKRYKHREANDDWKAYRPCSVGAKPWAFLD